MNKKGQVFGELGNLGKGVAMLALVMVVALIVVGNVRTQVVDQQEDFTHGVNGSSAFNATHTLADAAMDIPGWVPLIIIVAIGGIILMLVRKAF